MFSQIISSNLTLHIRSPIAIEQHYYTLLSKPDSPIIRDTIIEQSLVGFHWYMYSFLTHLSQASFHHISPFQIHSIHYQYLIYAITYSTCLQYFLTTGWYSSDRPYTCIYLVTGQYLPSNTSRPTWQLVHILAEDPWPSIHVYH